MDTSVPPVDRWFPGIEEQRRRLARSSIRLVTLAPEDSLPWLTQLRVHLALRLAWSKTDDWLVANYLLLPDQLYFFCAIRDPASPLSWWMRRWQQRFMLLTAEPVWQWQARYLDVAIACHTVYDDQWRRLQEMPRQRGLISDHKPWPYQGCLHPIDWW